MLTFCRENTLFILSALEVAQFSLTSLEFCLHLDAQLLSSQSYGELV
jgi:hypothetical protein